MARPDALSPQTTLHASPGILLCDPSNSADTYLLEIQVEFSQVSLHLLIDIKTHILVDNILINLSA